MTREESIALERLAHATGADHRAVEKLAATWQEFRRALNAEDHVAIMVLEDDLTRLLRGHALTLAGAAVARENVALAQMLVTWADAGVPREDREMFMDILLAVPAR